LPQRFTYRWTFWYGRDRSCIGNGGTPSLRLCRQFFVGGSLWQATSPGRIDPAAEGAFDLLTKAVAAGHPASLRRVAVRLHLFAGQAGVEQFAIGASAGGDGGAECRVGCVLTKQWVFGSQGVVPVARPGIFFGPGDQISADRVGFDVAMAGEHIALAVENGRFVPPFPQRPRAAALPVDMRDIAPPKRLHEMLDRVGPAGGDCEIELVCHEYVGVEGGILRPPTPHRVTSENLPVVLAEEHRLPVVAPLHYVVCLVRQNEASGAWHGGNLRFQGTAILWNGKPVNNSL
jgi:hypothetical protein